MNYVAENTIYVVCVLRECVCVRAHTFEHERGGGGREGEGEEQREEKKRRERRESIRAHARARVGVRGQLHLRGSSPSTLLETGTLVHCMPMLTLRTAVSRVVLPSHPTTGWDDRHTIMPGFYRVLDIWTQPSCLHGKHLPTLPSSWPLKQCLTMWDLHNTPQSAQRIRHVFSWIRNTGFTWVLCSALSVEAFTVYTDLKVRCFFRQSELFEDKYYLIIPNLDVATGIE